MSSTALTQYEDNLGGLTQWRPPETVLAEAKQAADALTRVISLKKNPVKFNGEIYLEFEDWQTCAKFYGVTAKVERTAFVQYGNVAGFEATAVAVDRNGTEISRAESLCLNDEENWGMVPKYEWEDELDENGRKIWVEGKDGKKRPKGKRTQVGETAKPLFQLKSMAQTRACSKVLRQVFAWIVVLAGYKPTPAEEMTGNEQFEEHGDTGKKPPVTMPGRASEKSAKEADTKTQAASTTTGSTTGWNAAATDKPGEKIISGIIESAKQAKSGSLWMTVKGEPLAIAVDEKNIDGDMATGNFIRFRGLNKHNDKFITEANPKGQFWSMLGLIELSKVQEGEVAAPDPNAKLDPENAALAEEMFGDKKPDGNAVIEDMKKNGQVTTASSLPATKPGTIGNKRAQRLYAIAHQNLKTNGGLTRGKRCGLFWLLTSLMVEPNTTVRSPCWEVRGV